jgi:pyruvate dehydrogenase E1 component beta subunit
VTVVALGHHGAQVAWRPQRNSPSEGIDIEVIDLRSVRPIDTATIIESVKKTNSASWPASTKA